ncbi:cell adhesion molecule Dscam1-like isoform X2 [Tachypleus tridentatus]|uniref:cell adhesion molecule Dscam1-like isoform X2 n=1 Tax=Tachypleus tridentatus TaxID=6853 RepID=UPI003FD18DCA
MMSFQTVLTVICIGLLTLRECENLPKNTTGGLSINKQLVNICGRNNGEQNVFIHDTVDRLRYFLSNKKYASLSFIWKTSEGPKLISLLCTFHLKKNIKVSYPVTQLLHRFRREVQEETKAVISGQTVVLTCPSIDQNVENIIWSKDDLKLPINPRQRILRNGSLTIKEVTQNADGGRYSCSYLDDKLRSRKNIINLRIIEPPTISPFQFSPDLVVGMTVRLMCFVVLGDSPFHFTWLKDGSTLSSSYGLNVQYFRDYSILWTENLLQMHSGNYTCNVKNDAGSTSYSAILTVNAPPSWTEEPQNSEVVQGKSVRIDCSASGSPTPTISWRKATSASVFINDNEPTDYTPVYNSHKYTLLPNGSLLVHSVGKTEEGFYLCEAQNGYGRNLNKLINLIVHQPPKFDIKFKSHSVQKGQTVALSCTASGDEPIELVWKKENRLLNNSYKYQFTISEIPQSHQVSILRIVRTSRNDSGIYSCHARNKYGEDEMKFQLLIQEAPGPPSNVSVTNVTGRTISLAWMEPYSGNSVISWYLIKYHKNLSGEQQRSISNISVDGSHRVAVLSDLEPATTYLISITAQNSVSWGIQSEWIAVKTEEEVPSGPPQDVRAQATGPNSIKVVWKPPRKDYWNGNIIGYYIGYRPADETMYMYKSLDVKDMAKRSQFHLTNLRRSTIYHIIIHAFNNKGLGPRSDETEVKTLDDVPPSAPDMEMLSKTYSSITLKWSQRTTFGTSRVEYTLHYREENDPTDWTEVPIATDQNQYVIENLKCGITYQFFMTSHNTVGRSEPSNKLNIKTAGAAPVSPAREDFIIVNKTKAYLDFSKWQDGGCSITSYTIKLKQKFHSQWRTLTENAPLDSRSPFHIQALSVATWYEVLVVAQNSAGATEAMYNFKTPNKTREMAISGTIQVPKYHYSAFIVDLEILIPIAVSSFVVLVVIIVGCVLCIREARSRRRRNENQAYGKTTQDMIPMKDIGSSPAVDYVSSEDGTQRSSPYSQIANHCPSNQSTFGPRPEEELHPYATPYDTLPVPPSSDNQQQSGTSDMHTLTRRGRTKRNSNVYSRMSQREQPYESLVLTLD